MRKFTTRKITFVALLTAISVVLRLLGFPQNSTFRIELGFLPITLIASIYGPIYSGLSYLVADIIGTLCTGQLPLPTITVCKILTGIIYGFFFYKRKRSLVKIIFSVLCISIFIDLFAMPYALMPIMGGKSFIAILTDRVYATLFNIPLRIVTIYITFKYLNSFISREAENNEHY